MADRDGDGIDGAGIDGDGVSGHRVCGRGANGDTLAVSILMEYNTNIYQTA